MAFIAPFRRKHRSLGDLIYFSDNRQKSLGNPRHGNPCKKHEFLGLSLSSLHEIDGQMSSTSAYLSRVLTLDTAAFTFTRGLIVCRLHTH